MQVLPIHFSMKVLCALLIFLTVQASCLSAVFDHGRNESVKTDSNTAPLHQLNCTSNPSVCNDVCSEPHGSLPYSSTFCDTISGTCICDCRDRLRKDCTKTPFTPCFQDCVRKNPNPDVFLYEGGNCPMSRENGTQFQQCACGCTVRDDYEETNDIF